MRRTGHHFPHVAHDCNALPGHFARLFECQAGSRRIRTSQCPHASLFDLCRREDGPVVQYISTIPTVFSYLKSAHLCHRLEIESSSRRNVKTLLCAPEPNGYHYPYAALAACSCGRSKYRVARGCQRGYRYNFYSILSRDLAWP